MGKLDGRFDAVFTDMSGPDHPGAALLVIEDDRTIYKGCYGLADLETRRPITTDTSFYLASISKPFTAMAIMLLVEDGRLSYEDRLRTFFPQLPPWAADISVRHLLNHTAGFAGYLELFSPHTEIPEWTRDMIGITNEAVFERVAQLTEPKFPAGARYFYSGIGYALLAMIVALISRQSFADFLKANVFDVLGMRNTVVYDASRPALHKVAHGYWNSEGKYLRWDYPLLTSGDGGIFSTLDDLLLWDQALNSERLVSRGALEQAFTSGTTSDGTQVGYGFGWITNVLPYCTTVERDQLLALGVADLRHVAHGGSLVAYYNYMIRFLDTRRTIIVLSNHQSARSPRIRGHQVAEILFAS